MRVKYNVVHTRAEADDVLVYDVKVARCFACAPRAAAPDDIAADVSKHLGVILRMADGDACKHDPGRQHWCLVYREMNGRGHRR